ncbi:MAG TPA: response regulator [Phototrophicaceae bacterium]|nr:response regulator [Phototrophicaceae bacterium]
MKGDSEKKIGLFFFSLDEIAIQNVKQFTAMTEEFQLSGVASNFEEGLERIARLLPDIVIVDVRFNSYPGQTVAKIKNALNDNDTRVIFSSISDSVAWVQESLRAGVGYFLSKPLDYTEFYDTLKIALSRPPWYL